MATMVVRGRILVSWINFLLLLLLIPLLFQHTESTSVCQTDDFKYDFTECDAYGGKWRVRVPKTPNRCQAVGGPWFDLPTRVHSCYTLCDGGQFFNKSSLLCENCQPGHFSLSGGIVYDNFNQSFSSKNSGGTPDPQQSLPDGFHIVTEEKNRLAESSPKCPDWYVDPATGSLVYMAENKLENLEAGCVSVVSYTAKVVKRGRLRFTYHYQTPNDMSLSILFIFHYRLYDGMGVIDDDLPTNIKFPMVTVKQNLETIEIPLKTPGLYVFTWKSVVIGNFRNFFDLSMSMPDQNFDTGGYDGGNERNLFQSKLSSTGLIMIKRIIIEGVAFASECTPCEPGAYAPRPGMPECLACPANTAYNGSGATGCQRCDPVTEFSATGATRCMKRPVCGRNDYYTVAKGLCNPKTLTRSVEYRWIEPKICVDLNHVLPKGELAVNCTINDDEDHQCDLGMELRAANGANGQYCQFCPDGHYRDETIHKCQPCPPITNPFYALSVHRWNNSLPAWSGTEIPLLQDDNPALLNTYFSRECFWYDDDDSPRSRLQEDAGTGPGECASNVAWQPFDDHIRTGASAPLNAYLVLSFSIPFLRSNNGTEISFEFKINCDPSDQCLLLFVETRPDESDLRLQQQLDGGGGNDFTKPNFQGGDGSGRRKSFSFTQQTINEIIKEWSQQIRDKTVFTYRIERNVSSTFSWVFKRTNSFQSYARINWLMVTGSGVGSAIRCQTCPVLSESYMHCISCPSGQYLDRAMSELNATNNESSSFQICKNCPKNHILNGNNGDGVSVGIESCIPCPPNLISDNETNQCYSNCYVEFDHQDRYDLHSIAQPIVYKGISLFTAGGTQYLNLFRITLCGHRKRDTLSTCINNITMAEDASLSSGVRSFICRSTIIPDGSKIFVTQSASLGDQLLGITRHVTFENTTVHQEFLNHPNANRYDRDFHLFYKTQATTKACPAGRRLTVTMRCQQDLKDVDTVVRTPTSCPSGTCNGCDFHLLIETRTGAACRLCQPYSETDYETVVGECVDGQQSVHYLNPKRCVVAAAEIGKKYIIKRACSLLLPRQVQIGIVMAIALGLLLLLLVFYFWNKNRSLEYKYTKLIENTGKGGPDDDDDEMDNCCVVEDDGEDEDGDRPKSLYRNDSHNGAIQANNSNGRTKKSTVEKLVVVSESDERQQLFPSNGKHHHHRHGTIDDEGYETIHLISATTNSNHQKNAASAKDPTV